MLSQRLSGFETKVFLLFATVFTWNTGPVYAVLVPGAAFHLDAADDASFSIDGGGQFGLVSQWNDLGTSATHLSQANADARPNRTSAVAPSGLPAVVYGSLPDTLDRLGNTSQQPWSGIQHTVFVVWNPPLLTAGPELLAFENGGGGAGRRTIKLSYPVADGGSGQGIIAFNPNGSVLNGNYADNEWIVSTQVWQNGAGQALNRIIGPDNVAHDVFGEMSLGAPSGDQMWIGWSGGNVTYQDGSIAEVLIYNSILTPEEIAANESFLFNKWLTQVPEPSSMILLGSSLLFVARLRRWGRRR